MLACSILALAAVGLQAAEDNASAAKAREAKCITVLKSNAPVGEKAAACKQLALCGTKDAVPALMPLLADEHLAAWARIPLEVIPDSVIDETLRESLGSLKGRCLIGAIHSIGRRGDTKAVALIAAKLKAPDAAVAVASALALGDIGDAAAAAALEDALTNTPPAVRSAAAEGCILCAEKCLASGKTDEAVKIYDLVRKADLPSQRIRAAIRGAILARKAAGVPLLVELLRSEDKQMFNLGLTVARELPGKEAADALAAEFAKAAPERQALLVLAIADRGDLTGLPALLQVAKSGPDSVRISLVKLLKQSGNASCVPLLLQLAVDRNAELAAAAVESLSDMSGKEVDAEIVARLPKAEGKARLLLLQLVGDRMLTKAIPEVIKAASDPDLQVRLQALATLGYAVEFKDLSVLIVRVAVAPGKRRRGQGGGNRPRNGLPAHAGYRSLCGTARRGDGRGKDSAAHPSSGDVGGLGRHEGPASRRRGRRGFQRRNPKRRHSPAGKMDDAGRGAGAGNAGPIALVCEVSGTSGSRVYPPHAPVSDAQGGSHPDVPHGHGNCQI